MKLKMIVAAVAATASASAFAAGSMNDQVQNNGGGVVNVRTDANYSQQVLNNQNVTGTALDILHARKSGDLASNAIYIGGKGEIYGTYGNVSGNNNGNYVPGTLTAGYDGGTNSATNIKMPYADIALTSTIGDWVTGFADLQVTNVGSSNVTLPNAYFIVGNLQKSPVYFVGGKKVVDFGKFSSPNNFMPTLTRAYFMAYGGQVAAGYSQNGINAAFTLMNGLGESMLNSGASNANQVNDFALSASYNGTAGKVKYYAGAGYINATGFSHTANTVSALGDSNNTMVGAVDFNGGMTVQGLSVNGEFLITTQGVRGMNSTSVYQNAYATNTVAGGIAGTSAVADSTGYAAFGFNALPALISFDSGSTVKAWSLDSSYTMPVAGKDMVPYVTYSQVAQNSDNNLYQIEVGTRYNIIDTVWVGGSYNYMSGKSGGSSIGKFNTVMLDATAYF
ncbi:LbtU family siderophore porin [Fangia hongkongensis]|uniref:LbtU family siderophore porin n=1 Tax=Fangia hongkongensis TaxID=270495 RepID=UPI000382792C|nr:LbtU family siderophore porin [Fangia hongkongensis]MBK2123807.1 LbtU family siderophore porin [Fangia hongkongensis]